jgi:phospholipid transport system transporter-binding protein
MAESFTVTNLDDRCQVSGVLDFTTARAALEQLNPLVEGSPQLQVDLTEVTHCNSAALALLIELKAVAHRTGHEVTFSAIPDALLQLAKVCQVENYLV